MADNENEPSYYIRIKGRVFGPYSLKQLEKLRSRGQFSQSNEVSSNGQTWVSAATLVSLFAATPKKASSREQAAIDVGTEPSTNGSTSVQWYYSIDDKQHGPVTQTALQELLETGQVNLNDLVWKEGMPNWESASDVPEFNRVFSLTEKAGKKKSRKSQGASVHSHQILSSPHFLDRGLEILRNTVSESFVWTSGHRSTETGRFAMYTWMVLNLIFSFSYAFKFKTTEFVVFGIALSVFGIALQYSAIKSCGAIAKLIQSMSLRMSSTAFLDSMIFFSIFGGLAILLGFTTVALRLNDPVWLVIGIVFFFVCEQLGLTLLHPSGFGITVSENATAGEDAIALLALFLMLPLRSVPSIFAIGQILGIIGVCAALFLLFGAEPDPKFELFPPERIYSIASTAALTCAAFPITMYFYFVMIYLFLDVKRAILVVPGKLDQLKTQFAFKTNGQNNDTITNEQESVEKVAGY